ncbi:hypothetical protein KC345_g236 [Hortaea werneckii]|nr:hypothetical protein KC345_g236 [Hortaea werneckii]
MTLSKTARTFNARTSPTLVCMADFGRALTVLGYIHMIRTPTGIYGTSLLPRNEERASFLPLYHFFTFYRQGSLRDGSSAHGEIFTAIYNNKKTRVYHLLLWASAGDLFSSPSNTRRA